MKTWEMIKELTENPNKKFKLVGFGGNGETNIVKLNKKTNVIAWDGDEFLPLTVRKLDSNEWEEVKEPVSFMEAVESGKKVRVEHDFIYDDTSRLKEEYVLLDVMLWVLGENLGPRSVQDIIMNGKFYIED